MQAPISRAHSCIPPQACTHLVREGHGDGRFVLPGDGDVLPELLRGEGGGFEGRGAPVTVHVKDVLCEGRVTIPVSRVEQQPHDVESRQERRGEVDVLLRTRTTTHELHGRTLDSSRHI